MLLTLGLMLIGFTVSFLSGMLGISGGSILMPTLLLILTHSQYNPDMNSVHLAINTSLAIIVLNSIINSYEQFRAKRISWKLLYIILPGAMIGVFIGTSFSIYFNTNHTAFIAASTLILLALIMSYQLHYTVDHPKTANTIQLAISGLLIGVPASYLGIGGGSIMMPILNYLGIDIQKIIGASAILSLITSFISLSSLLAIKLYQTHQASNTLLIVDWYAVLSIFPMMLIGIRLGSKCLHLLTNRSTKHIFIAILLIMGISMLMT